MKNIELKAPVKSWFIFQGIVGFVFLFLGLMPINKNIDVWGRTGSIIVGSTALINSMLVLGKGH